MNNEQRMKNLSTPTGKIDVVLDTDAYNEIDDQFAISYLLRSKEKLNTKAIYAAPFHNTRSVGPKDGMEKSYDEIFRLLDVLDEKVDVFRGSESFLADEKTPVISDAARDLAQRAESYSPENPLYVIAIAAITNIASAILLNPKVAENTVVVWLGGHSCDMHNTMEFNMMQDVAAARVVMGSGNHNGFIGQRAHPKIFSAGNLYWQILPLRSTIISVLKICSSQTLQPAIPKDGSGIWQGRRHWR